MCNELSERTALTDIVAPLLEIIRFFGDLSGRFAPILVEFGQQAATVGNHLEQAAQLPEVAPGPRRETLQADGLPEEPPRTLSRRQVWMSSGVLPDTA